MGTIMVILDIMPDLLSPSTLRSAIWSVSGAAQHLVSSRSSFAQSGREQAPDLKRSLRTSLLRRRFELGEHAGFLIQFLQYYARSLDVPGQSRELQEFHPSLQDLSRRSMAFRSGRDS